MMKNAFCILVAVFMLSGGWAHGQVLRLDGTFRDFVTFYVSSVDVSTGATDVELFDYTLSSDSYPVEVSVEFSVLINSAPLNLDYSRPFLHVTTQSFTLLDEVHIRNTDLNINTDHLEYVDGEPLSITVNDPETIFDDPDFNPDAMQSLIIQSGRLPDGIYRLDLVVNNLTNPGGSVRKEESIISAHPISLELISPGGPFAEIQNQTIMTTYPFFQWQSDPCAICSYRIRVARFIPNEHSSAEDAIEDQTVLPIEQALGWYPEQDMDGKFLPTTSFQYPQSGAVDLEPGNIYVWQVQKIIPTTEGDEFINSVIYAFMIEEQQAGYDPIKEAVRTVLGDERYEQLFGVGGELMGFVGDEESLSISGSISVDGTELEAGNIDVSTLLLIARLIEQGEISVVESEVQ
ncbi:MAG: hypothetical protein JSU77_01760 [Fidelibacterota bacterium]|nr:MAG: hypothetical protein JSU77_01760 [Candidatus Neomarinimicrobiota bacterium]